MKIGIFTNPEKDPDGALQKAVKTAADRLGIDACNYVAGEFFDFILSIGGDGTILRIAEDSAKSGIPILGVNRGKVGFLTEIEPEELNAALSRLKNREYYLERRAMLDISFRGKHRYALNDAVLMRTGGGRVITVEVGVNGETLDRVNCDGYILSTPTGSTAYSLSAGGSIVAPGAAVISVTPLNPHALHTRPVIVGSSATITMKYVSGTGAVLYTDGEGSVDLELGETVETTGWDMSALFVRMGDKTFFSRLKNKIGER